MLNIPLRRVFRALWALCAVCLVAALPVLVLDFKAANYSVHYQAFFVAGLFVLLALPVSIYEVAMHLEYLSRPKLQLRVIRILWMVPIYAVDSLITLRYIEGRLYLDPIRECYEAFVIYNFYMFLIAYLEEEYGDVAAYFSTKPDVPHMWGFQYLFSEWEMGDEFFWQCKKGVMGYVILRPVMTAVGTIAELAGVYGDGVMQFNRVYPYTTFINAAAQFWALYCLVLMYHACKQELAPIRPLSKFICIKAVIFFSYWQSVAISIMVAVGIIRSQASWSTYGVNDVAAGLQEFLICIEMFAAALAHAYAFPPGDYMDPAHQPRGFTTNLRNMFDVRDVVDDVQEIMEDTTENMTQATHGAWRQTKKTTATVANAPRSLVRMLGRFGGSQTSSSTDLPQDEEFDGRRALLGQRDEFVHSYR